MGADDFWHTNLMLVVAGSKAVGPVALRHNLRVSRMLTRVVLQISSVLTYYMLLANPGQITVIAPAGLPKRSECTPRFSRWTALSNNLEARDRSGDPLLVIGISIEVDVKVIPAV